MIYLKEDRQAVIGYNMTEVIKLIKVGEKKMWRMVHEGILVPDHIQIMKDGRKQYYFNKEKVHQFLENKNVG
jgi:hypothetical protein